MTGFFRQHRGLMSGLILLSLLLSGFCALLAGNSYWNVRISSSDERLATITNALSSSNLLPRSYFAKIEALPQVASVTEFSSVAVFVANERQVYTGVIVDKDQITAVFPRMAVVPGALKHWVERKDAVLVSAKLLASQNLAVGDMLPTRLFYGGEQQNQEFYIAGTFDTDNELKCNACVFLGRDFADQTMPSYRGVVASYHIRISPESDKLSTRHSIDALFKNETPATRTTDFLPASTGFLNDLIDLRELVLLAFCMTLAAAILLPALCANMTAISYRASFALLLALGQKKKQLMIRCLLLACCSALVIGAGGYLLAWVAGGWLFEDIIWLRFESARSALIGSFGVGVLIACTACLAVQAVLATLTVDHLFSENTD